ncbi:Pvc16 family protein [Roseobacteraceae bacterium S113]
MAVTPSSLSIAIQGFADYLATQFAEGVTVTVDTPQKAHEAAKGAQNDLLNVFVYRLAPSGVHPDLTPNAPTFLRASILITPFPRGSGDDGETDLDLRVLGHALAVLQSAPVIPVVLPGGGGLHPQTTFYRLQAVLQAPTMEELNHIWTTQGGELGYRLSAAYELALIPVEPLIYADPPTPVRAALLDVSPEANPGLSPAPLAITGATSPAPWAPTLMFEEASSLANTRSLPPAATEVSVAAVGSPGAQIDITLDWTRADASTDTTTIAAQTITATSLDSPDAALTLPLGAIAAGDSARISAKPTGIADAVAGNVIELTVEA